MAGPTSANWAFHYYSTLEAAAVDHRGVLDHISSLRHEHLKSRVVEIADRPALEARLECLISATVQADEVAAGAQGEPVKVDNDREGHRSQRMGANQSRHGSSGPGCAGRLGGACDRCAGAMPSAG